MILVFDMDDTLYPERDYVLSGFNAVSKDLATRFGIDESDAFNRMVGILNSQGRGKIFDNFLLEYGIFTKSRVRDMVAVYRSHIPNISLTNDVRELLIKLGKSHQLYLVTDGNYHVQNRKIMSLGLEDLFVKTYATHRHGIKNAKPSVHCFELIAKLENVPISRLTYVGDDPHKDFIGLNAKGARTIRVNQGRFRNIEVDPTFDAGIQIENLRDILDFVHS
jgi:putative hydrolase of the HAD superfamily